MGFRPQVCGIQQLALVAACVPQPECGWPRALTIARENLEAACFQGNPCAVAAGVPNAGPDDPVATVLALVAAALRR